VTKPPPWRGGVVSKAEDRKRFEPRFLSRSAPPPTSRTSSPLFGPWSPAIKPVGRIAQLRCGLAAAFCGSAHPLVGTLRAAEAESEVAVQALAMLDRVPSHRRMLAVFARVTWRRSREGAADARD